MRDRLRDERLDAIPVHELIHIRGHDYLVNLIQAFTETLLFNHSAVWLISRQIRIEREYCCDNAAILACGNTLGYVRALAAIEHGRVATVPAMWFLGNSTNMTLNRIAPILKRSPSIRQHWAGVPECLAGASSDRGDCGNCVGTDWDHRCPRGFRRAHRFG
jgi:beta-lactamase regulating signal transducer with metallopeptidase domain